VTGACIFSARAFSLRFNNLPPDNTEDTEHTSLVGASVRT
jgi:hypothetical protein